MSLNKVRKYILIFGTIILLGFLWHYFVSARPWDIRIPTIKNAKALPDYEFSGITVSEVSGAKTFFRLDAEKLALDKQTGLLTKIRGDLLTDSRPVFFFQAQQGTMDFRRENMLLTNFSGNTYKDYWYVRSTVAVWDQQHEQMILEKNPVLWNKLGILTASKIIYHAPYQLFTIGPDCELKTETERIASKRTVLKEQIQTLTFEENVEFDTKDFKGRSDTCDIDYGKLEYRFKGNVLFRYDDVVIHALYVTYDKKTEEIRLTGDIRFVAGTNTVTSERAVIKRKEKIVEFYENTKASQGGSYIESQHMQYDLNKKEFIASTGRTRIIKNND